MRASVVFLVVMLFLLPYTQHQGLVDNTDYFPSPPYQVEPENTSTSPVDYAWSNMQTMAAFTGELTHDYQDQNLGWSYDLGAGHKYDVDAEGNWYFMGEFYDNVTFGNTTLVPLRAPDIFVAKLNHNGDWAWAKAIVGGNRYGGEARALQVFDDGSVYITGTFRSNITLGSIKLSTMSESCSSCNSAEANAQDVFVAKLDENGEWLWATSGGGTATDEPYAMELTSQGEAVILGQTQAGHHWNVTFGDTVLTNNDTESFVAKLSSDGDWLWANQYGICEGYCTSDTLHVSKDGAIYIAPDPGRHRDSGGQPIFGELYAEPHTNGSKTYITMVAPNGSFVWLKSFNTNHTSSTTAKFVILDIATNVQGDVYFGGVWNEGRNRVETDDELRVISYNRSDHDRGFIAKMTHDGRLLWASHVHSIGWMGGEGPYDTNGGSTISELVVGENNELMVLGATGYTRQATYNITYEYKLGSMTLSGGRSFVSAISEDGTWEWSVVGSGSYKYDRGSIKALQHLDFLGERLVVSGFTGERGASLDPYNIEVDNGIVHFTADVVLLDEDGDGVGNSVDECPQGVTNWSSNGETDTDKDGCRDADEDNDDDNDGIPDDRDECPGYDNSNDMDCDRIPDWEDDSDGDGVVDQDDICPGIDDRLDTDKDEIPDCQDEDDDNDGINDADDACPLIDQEIDWNCNGINDLQDDSDDDGVVDWYDKCQGSDDAIDRNENQIPDGCEEIEQETEASVNQSEVNQSEGNQPKVDDGNNGTSTENDDAENAPSLEKSTTDSFMSNSTLISGIGGLVLLILAGIILARRRGKEADARAPPIDVAWVEAYVQQLVNQGHPEDIARAHATAYYISHHQE